MSNQPRMKSIRLLSLLLLAIMAGVVVGCGGPKLEQGKTPTGPAPLFPSPSPLPTRPPITPTLPPVAPSSPQPRVTATPSPTPVPSPTPTVELPAGWAWVSVLHTSLRDNPAGQPVASLRAGEKLDLLAMSPDRAWFYVRYQAAPQEAPQEGWVLAQDVRTFVPLDAVSTLIPQEGLAAMATSSPPASPQAQGVVLAHKLRLRAGPGLDQPILGHVMQGEEIRVLGRSDHAGWLKVRTSADQVGWVAAPWVRISVDVVSLPVVGHETTGVPRPQPSPQGTILFQDRPGGTIYLIRADGSGLQRVTTGLDPAWSPDGRQIAFTRWRSEGDGVFVRDLRSGEERLVVRANKPRSPTWTRDGRALIFDMEAREESCRQTPFGCMDEAQLRALFQGQDCGPLPGLGWVCIADLPLGHRVQWGLQKVDLQDGSRWDLPASDIRAPRHHPTQPGVLALGKSGAVLVDAVDSEPPQRIIEYGFLGAPVYSPDGAFIYVSRKDGDSWNIWRYRADGSQPLALTHPPLWRDRPVHNVAPAVSPDGRYVLFLTNRRGPWELWIMTQDGRDPHPFAPQALRAIHFQFDFGPSRMVDWGH